MNSPELFDRLPTETAKAYAASGQGRRRKKRLEHLKWPRPLSTSKNFGWTVDWANGRNFIGIEINPDYYPEIQSKTQQNGFILRAEKSLAGRMRPYSSCPMT